MTDKVKSFWQISQYGPTNLFSRANSTFLPWKEVHFCFWNPYKIQIHISKIFFHENHRSNHTDTFRKLLKHLKEYWQACNFFLFYHLFYTHDVSPIFQSLQRILYLWCTYWDTSCLSVLSPNAGTTKSERCCNAQSTWCYFLYETTTKTFNQLNWFNQLNSCTC